MCMVFGFDLMADAEETDYNNMIEVSTNIATDSNITANRGDTLTPVITIKNISANAIEGVGIDQEVFAMSDGDINKDLVAEMNFTLSQNIINLGAGESVDIQASLTVPGDLVSSQFWMEFFFGITVGEEVVNLDFLAIGVEVAGGTLNPFTDVRSSDWFFPYAMSVYENRIMTGMDADTFGPTVLLSRAQFATILWRLDYEPVPESKVSPFPDVPAGQFYTTPAIWAQEVKVITGYENGKFGPNDNITREQMALMMYRFAKYWGNEFAVDVNALNAFPDASKVSGFAKEAMAWAVQEGIITGDSGKLNPQGSANRAHCATIVSRFMDKF